MTTLTGPAIDGWLAYLIDEGHADNTIAAYRTDLAHLHRFLGGVGEPDWWALTPARLEAFAGQQRQRHSPATVARRVACVRSFLGWLAREGACDPELAGVLRYDHVPRRATGVYPAGPAALICTAQPWDTGPAGLRDLALVRLLHAGLAVSEAMGLDCGDVDDTRASVYVHGRSERRVFLPQPARDALAAYLERGRLGILLVGKTPAVFVGDRRAGRRGDDSERLTRQGACLILRARARRLRLPAPSPSGLRHAGALALLRDGASFGDVALVLGHASVATTTALYGAAATRRVA